MAQEAPKYVNEKGESTKHAKEMAAKFDVKEIQAKKADERSKLEQKMLDTAISDLPNQKGLTFPADPKGALMYEVKSEDVKGGVLAILARECPATELNDPTYARLAYGTIFREAGGAVNIIEPGDQVALAEGELRIARRTGSSHKDIMVPLYPWNLTDVRETPKEKKQYKLDSRRNFFLAEDPRNNRDLSFEEKEREAADYDRLVALKQDLLKDPFYEGADIQVVTLNEKGTGQRVSIAYPAKEGSQRTELISWNEGKFSHSTYLSLAEGKDFHRANSGDAAGVAELKEQTVAADKILFMAKDLVVNVRRLASPALLAANPNLSSFDADLSLQITDDKTNGLTELMIGLNPDGQTWKVRLVRGNWKPDGSYTQVFEKKYGDVKTDGFGEIFEEVNKIPVTGKVA